jgi:hypothetical protein
MSRGYPIQLPRCCEHRTAQPVPDSHVREKGTALLTVTVAEADVFRLRHALNCAGPQPVQFIKTTRIPRDNSVRLDMEVDADAARETMSNIIGAVGAAEFGRITFRDRGL